LFLLLLLLVLPWPAAAGSVDQAYEKARKAYYNLLESPRKQKYRDQWKRVSELFLAVPKLDDDHPLAADALYMAGKTGRKLYENSYLSADARDALSHFEHLVRNHPASSLADDALALSAEIYKDILEEPGKAYLCYRRILDNYGNGDMKGKARAEIAALSPPDAAAGEKQGYVDAVGGRLKSIRHASYDERTRVVVDMEGEPSFEPMRLKGDRSASIPHRVLVDIPAESIESGIERSVAVEDGRVRKIRVGQYAPGIARVVLELEESLEFKAFSLTDPPRVILDVAATQTPAGETVSADAATPSPGGGGDGISLVLDQASPDQPMMVRVPKFARSGSRDFCIVVDPGHGGRDPGAIGPSGLLEKDVTLAMARLLADRLRRDLNCKVVLTRDRDVYLPLNQRTDIANKLGADLFISLHANANKSSRPYGVETFYLNFSKNQKAMEVVARENDTSLKQVGDLEMILLDLMANSKINESSRLATKVQKAMVGHLDLHYTQIRDLGVRQGPFYVLLGATMPSVLVESAFISNPREENRLRSPNYQKKTAEAIVKGVQEYLNSFRTVATQ
ncbi:MAG TPA: N-acetylmuramoyl-L-alanine amidase, partial [Desulfuromonadales bacterium]|nr:N-acetylmuramoyl-L-alanine amidase [Desulfuromonadales bacterium]